MSGSPRWPEVEELFQEALACGGEERAKLLAGAGQKDAVLRAEVESLLAAYERSTAVLESCFVHRPPREETLAWEGRRLGSYAVLREVARGGMSRVFLAARADAQFEQLVVIKIVEPEICSPSLVRRFLQERQILANLDHPGIAKLLDGSTTEQGVPYLVLELVDGLPIDRYCDQHRLAVRQRVGLLLEVCAAVAHAHRSLVVHRDLKPANILVTRGGRVKLLDFGIAKLLDPTPEEAGVEATRTVLRPLTPRYASPEQLRGAPLTTATDVFSLGVILYELLTGVSPFAQGDGGGGPPSLSRRPPVRPSLRAATAEAAARRGGTPRALSRQLAGDLDTVVLGALAENPQDRYPSVERLVDDLRRWLGDRPISTRRPSLAYRARKLVKRNPLATTLGGAAALMLVLLAGSQVVQSRRVARERNVAEQALAFLSGIFEGADPTAGGAERVTVRQLLDAGAARAQEELAGAPEAQARMLEVLGEVYAGLGLADSARPLLERSLELRRTLHGERSTEVARSFHRLGELGLRGSDMALAERWLRRALALYEDLGAEPAQVAAVIEDLGEALAVQDRYAEAEPLLRQALALQRSHLEGREIEAAETSIQLAELLRRSGRWGEVEPLLRQALELRRRAAGERSALVATSLANLGIFLNGRGDYEEAARLYRESLAVWRARVDGDHPEIARVLQNLGTGLLVTGELDEAEEVLRESLAMLRRLHGDAHQNTAFGLDSWGTLLALRGDYRHAEETFEQALEIRRRVLGERHSLFAVLLARRADVRRLRGHREAAEADYSAALELLEVAPQQLQTARAIHGLGRLLVDQGRLGEAEARLRDALARRKGLLPAGHERIAEAEIDLAGCLLLAGRSAEGEPLLRQAHAALSARLGPAHERVVTAARLLAAAGRLDGSPASAAELDAAAAAWRSSF